MQLPGVQVVSTPCISTKLGIAFGQYRSIPATIQVRQYWNFVPAAQPHYIHSCAALCLSDQAALSCRGSQEVPDGLGSLFLEQGQEQHCLALAQGCSTHYSLAV